MNLQEFYFWRAITINKRELMSDAGKIIHICSQV